MRIGLWRKPPPPHGLTFCIYWCATSVWGHGGMKGSGTRLSVNVLGHIPGEPRWACGNLDTKRASRQRSSGQNVIGPHITHSSISPPLLHIENRTLYFTRGLRENITSTILQGTGHGQSMYSKTWFEPRGGDRSRNQTRGLSGENIQGVPWI